MQSRRIPTDNQIKLAYLKALLERTKDEKSMDNSVLETQQVKIIQDNKDQKSIGIAPVLETLKGNPLLLRRINAMEAELKKVSDSKEEPIGAFSFDRSSEENPAVEIVYNNREKKERRFHLLEKRMRGSAGAVGLKNPSVLDEVILSSIHFSAGADVYFANNELAMYLQQFSLIDGNPTLGIIFKERLDQCGYEAMRGVLGRMRDPNTLISLREESIAMTKDFRASLMAEITFLEFRVREDERVSAQGPEANLSMQAESLERRRALLRAEQKKMRQGAVEGSPQKAAISAKQMAQQLEQRSIGVAEGNLLSEAKEVLERQKLVRQAGQREAEEIARQAAESPQGAALLAQQVERHIEEQAAEQKAQRAMPRAIEQTTVSEKGCCFFPYSSARAVQGDVLIGESKAHEQPDLLALSQVPDSSTLLPTASSDNGSVSFVTSQEEDTPLLNGVGVSDKGSVHSSQFVV